MLDGGIGCFALAVIQLFVASGHLHTGYRLVSLAHSSLGLDTPQESHLTLHPHVVHDGSVGVPKSSDEELIPERCPVSLVI